MSDKCCLVVTPTKEFENCILISQKVMQLMTSKNKALERTFLSLNDSLRASSPFGSHAIFILGEIYLGLARDLGASRERIGTGAR